MRVPKIIAAASNGTGGIDEAKRDEIAARFREAFEADVEEEVRAEMIYELNRSMWGRRALYIAVGNVLGTRYKNAIREYVRLHEQRRVPRLYEAVRENE